jgi:DinB superfamily
MPRSSLPIEQLLIALAETPERIAESTDRLTQAQLHTTPGLGEWSANEVLAHLRSCADVWGDCIAKIITEHRPTIRAVNPRTWIKSTDYPKQKFRSSLQAFAKQRSELLTILEPLAQKDWSRQATVVGAGAALERTVEFYAQWLAQHERPHVKQIKRIADTIRRQQ